MRHYLLYHNPESMGYDFDGNSIEELAARKTGTTTEAEIEELKSSDFVFDFIAVAEQYSPFFEDWKFPGNPEVVEEDMPWEDPNTGLSSEISEEVHSIVTNNTKEAKECIGNRIWIIQGEFGTSPRKFWLHGYFDADGYLRRPQALGSRKFQYLIYGQRGDLVCLEDAIEVTNFDWFKGLKEYFGNFGRGFREVGNPEFVEKLQKTFESH